MSNCFLYEWFYFVILYWMKIKEVLKLKFLVIIRLNYNYFVVINKDGFCFWLFGKCSGKYVCVLYFVWCDG